jgi:hypothetical protein
MFWRALAGFTVFSFVASISSLCAEEVSPFACTLKSDGGGTCTLQFLVPPTTGSCELVAFQPALAGDDFGPAEIPDRPVGSARYGQPYGYISSRVSPPDTRSLSPLGRLLISGVELRKLGTVSTRDGSTYHGSRLVTADQESVIILDNEGFYRILYVDLDPDTRQQLQASSRPAPRNTGDSLAGL